MKLLKYKYNPNKKGVFRVSVVKNPAVGEGDLVLMNSEDGPIKTYADMLVRNPEGKVLLLQRNPECDFEPNKWGFPGGKVMPGETTKEGGLRECLEECGVIINPESVSKIGEVVNDEESTSHYFEGTPTNEPKLGDEHQNLAWVDLDDLDDYDLIAGNKERFADLIGGKVLMASDDIVKGIFYSPVMIPDLKITRVDKKTGEKYQVYYDSETIEELMHNYMKQCGNANTNLDHEKDNTDGVYPVESWIVNDPENDKSKAIGMPLQKAGTWIMGYKADNPEVLQKIKDNLLQGLSIEGFLDAEEEMSINFNKQQTMSEKKESALKKLGESLLSVFTLMNSEGEEGAKEKTPEEIAAEEKAKMEADEAAKKAAEEEGAGATELDTLKAENDELKKKVADLEAELAKYENDATLMSAQVEKIKSEFESYKAVQMSSQSLLNQPKQVKPLEQMTPLERFRATK